MIAAGPRRRADRTAQRVQLGSDPYLRTRARNSVTVACGAFMHPSSGVSLDSESELLVCNSDSYPTRVRSGARVRRRGGGGALSDSDSDNGPRGPSSQLESRPPLTRMCDSDLTGPARDHLTRSVTRPGSRPSPSPPDLRRPESARARCRTGRTPSRQHKSGRTRARTREPSGPAPRRLGFKVAGRPRCPRGQTDSWSQSRRSGLCGPPPRTRAGPGTRGGTHDAARQG